jgi:alpha-tubulin suppressor-like RCC1 family protein
MAVTAGAEHNCALDADGAVWCWGDNRYGQLGDGTLSDRSGAVMVLGLANVLTVEAGAQHTCAVRRDGAVLCWGRNHLGQLGDGTTSDRVVPGVVPGL